MNAGGMPPGRDDCDANDKDTPFLLWIFFFEVVVVMAEMGP